jgi:voltage-gated potassium channel
MMTELQESNAEKEVGEAERSETLTQLEEWLETPVMVLGFVWLALLIVEFTWGASPMLELALSVIWLIFVVDFGLRLVLAPHKLAYLKRNWLTAVSLFVPALRLLQITRLAYLLRLARVTRGLQLVKVVASLNRGMRALRRSMARRGFGYVAVLTAVVTLVGAAGMYTFERGLPNGEGLQSYGDALWWTAMVMTTLGSAYWPVTEEGRILGFLLAVYAAGVFGYLTASLATFFIGRDASNQEAEVVGADDIEALRQEIAALRAELRAAGGVDRAQV